MKARLFSFLFCTALAASAVSAQEYRTPKTPSGHPDLQGIWNTQFVLPIEARPDAPNLVISEAESKALAARIVAETIALPILDFDPEIAGMHLTSAQAGMALVQGQRRSRQVVQPADGKIPFTPRGRTEANSIDRSVASPTYVLVADNPESRPGWERCTVLQGAPPVVVMNSPNPRNIVQTRDHVVIHTEYGDEARIVPFTDKHGPPELTSKLGDSIARWEGETLVVETIRLPPSERTRVFPTLIVPAASTVVERFRRVGENELLYQYTIIDPLVYAGPWLAEFSLYRQKHPMIEFACHEGNYSLENILASERQREARQRQGVRP